MSMPAPAHSANTASPQPLIGLPTLMTMAFTGQELGPLGQQLLERAGFDDAEAFHDLSVLMQLQGNAEMGMTLQQEALSIKQHFTLEPARKQSDLKVLALVTPGDLMTNIPLEFIAEGAGFTLELLYVSPQLPMPNIVPDHDLAIMALSELDRNAPTLEMLAPILEQWPRPVMNLPENVVKLARDQLYQVLDGAEGISIPTTARLARTILQQVVQGELSLSEALQGVDFPVIVRPVDSHAGHGLEKLESAVELKRYLAEYADETFFVSRFVDYSGEDGQFRKFRIMVMQGRPYIAHMAISSHWMVHYLNAGMVENASKRLEEAYVMGTFEQGFAARHRAAFNALWQRTGVDYIGVDCAETPDGELLIFEAGTAMIVHSMDPVETYPYKRPQMNKLYAGFNQMAVRHIALNDIDNQLEQVMPFLAGRAALHAQAAV